MIKNSILNLDFKFFFLIPYFVWLLFIFFYIFNSELIKAGELDGFVKYGNDSSTYLFYAKQLTNFNFSNLDIAKLSYIILIAVVMFLKLNLTTVIILQFLTTIISSYCLYLMGKKMFSKWVGLICISFFLTYLPIQLRNFYLLTEILFINFSIILTYFVFFKKEKKFLISLMTIFVLFLRPQSFLILLSIALSIFVFSRFNKNYNLSLKLFVIFSFSFLLLIFTHIGINNYNLIDSFSKGIIWGYSFETRSICFKECISGLKNPSNYEKNILSLLLYIKDNFIILTKVSIYKIILFFTGWRPYYSFAHNLFVLIFHIPIYLLFCIYFLKFRKFDQFEFFTLFYVLLSSIFIGVTFADWSGRFIMFILPFIMIYASKSLFNLFLIFKYKFINKR